MSVYCLTHFSVTGLDDMRECVVGITVLDIDAVGTVLHASHALPYLIVITVS